MKSSSFEKGGLPPAILGAAMLLVLVPTAGCKSKSGDETSKTREGTDYAEAIVGTWEHTHTVLLEGAKTSSEEAEDLWQLRFGADGSYWWKMHAEGHDPMESPAGMTYEIVDERVIKIKGHLESMIVESVTDDELVLGDSPESRQHFKRVK